MAHNVNVIAQLEEQGFEVTAVEYDMFALAGGGVVPATNFIDTRTENETP